MGNYSQKILKCQAANLGLVDQKYTNKRGDAERSESELRTVD